MIHHTSYDNTIYEEIRDYNTATYNSLTREFEQDASCSEYISDLAGKISILFEVPFKYLEFTITASSSMIFDSCGN